MTLALHHAPLRRIQGQALLEKVEILFSLRHRFQHSGTYLSIDFLAMLMFESVHKDLLYSVAHSSQSCPIKSGLSSSKFFCHQPAGINNPG